jgi:molecular chaperone DnaK (HSP70)
MLVERFNDLKDRQGKDDVRNNIRAIKRLYKEASKVKEVLSANKVMQVKIPELLDYVTLDTMLYRTEFEERCEHLISRVADPVQ